MLGPGGRFSDVLRSGADAAFRLDGTVDLDSPGFALPNDKFHIVGVIAVHGTRWQAMMHRITSA